MRVAAVAFDKDGTLLDFDRTWSAVMATALHDSAPDPAVRGQLAAAIGFDLDAGGFVVDAPAVHLTNAEIAALADAHVDGSAFVARTTELAATSAVAVPDADETLAALRARALPLGVVTNDEERSARDQLASLGWAETFASVVGFDSGHGAKPAPGPVLAAAAQLGVPVERLALVGDTATDLTAARAAGAVAVLVGRHPDPARQAQLASLADCCLDRLRGLIDLVDP